MPEGFLHHERRSWVHLQGSYVPYPFQNNIRHLPGSACWDCVEGLLRLQREHPNTPPENFGQWIDQNFGKGIADHFMKPYNQKIWCTNPDDMNAHWVGDRVPTVDLERILRNISLEQDDVNWGPNATFQFPKTGGTGEIWNRLGRTLPEENIRLGTAVTGLNIQDKTITLADGSTDRYDHLVSTIPLDRLAAMTGVDSIRQRAAQLKHTRVQVAGIAPNQPIPDHLAEKTWLYCPDPDQSFYRVTPFSTFSPAHTPDPDHWCSFLCEVSTIDTDPIPEEKLKQQVMNDLNESGLIDFDPSKAHSYMMDAPYGYPIPTVDRDDILADVLPALEKHDIYSRGRFGGWKYEVANMDHSLMQGVEAINRILHGEPEVTLPTPNIVNAGKR